MAMTPDEIIIGVIADFQGQLERRGITSRWSLLTAEPDGPGRWKVLVVDTGEVLATYVGGPDGVTCEWTKLDT